MECATSPVLEACAEVLAQHLRAMGIDTEVQRFLIALDLANRNRKEVTAGPRPRESPATSPETCIASTDLISILPTQGESPQGPEPAIGTTA